MKWMPLQKLESAPGAWFKQAHESNASTDGLAHHFSSGNSLLFSFQSNGWINRFSRRQNTVHRILLGKNKSVNPGRVEDWKNYGLLQEGYGLCMYIMLMRSVSFSIYNIAKHPLFDETFPVVL
jgi:hypothetical protein